MFIKHELNKKADNVKKYEDAVSIVRAYEEIIKTRKKNIIHNFFKFYVNQRNLQGKR